MMRECTRCHTLRDESQFAIRTDSAARNRQDDLMDHCLSCQKEINATHYANNKAKIQQRSRERQAAIRAGTYVPDAMRGRAKRRADLPPPAAPIYLVGCHFDGNEYEFLEAEAARRGVKQEEIVRELIRAGMEARLSSSKEKH